MKSEIRRFLSLNSAAAPSSPPKSTRTLSPLKLSPLKKLTTMAGKKKRTKKSNKDGPNAKPRLKPVCKFHLQGRCNKGDQCTFLHSNENNTNNNGTLNVEQLPPLLIEALPLLSESQRLLATSLCQRGQLHLFQNTDTSSIQRIITKLDSINTTHPSGLLGYLSNAKSLLSASSKGVNPFDGWVPSIPAGESFTLGSSEFNTTEEVGLKMDNVGRCGFVLVAGGLGERLGYGDVKIGLPVEIGTGCRYLEFYCETILAFQSRYAPPGILLPLCIMTSIDTNDKTIQLLKDNNYFGMEPSQVTIVQQGMGVPALMDNDARIATVEVENNGRDVLLKPHGHGDIHALLHSHGVAKSWLDKGIQWMVFFQDTNALAFHTLPLALGVSSKLGLIMNSITCPRKAKQAIGAITKLTKGDQTRTINVEYNHLDPLLRADGSEGDVNDPNTGFSPYPGNINQLLFRLEDYVKALEESKGAMPEFVNPKYANEEKTVFKKPTRLECMMQDFPMVLTGTAAEKVGFTTLASEMCFSPVKNATVDGVVLQANGTHPGVAATGEADQSGAYRRLLCSIGCQVQEGIKVKYSGIEVVSGPDLVLKPSFALCSTELKKKFTNPSAVKITGRSSLVLKGEGLTIESLDLDGALVIECEPGTTGVIRNLTVRNDGWVKVHLGDDESCSEVIKMRGYRMNKIETRTIVFKKDGTVEGGYSQEESVVTEDVAHVEPKLTPAAEPTPEVKTRSTPEVKPTQNKPVEKEITSNNNHNNVPKAPIQREVVVDLSKPASTEQKDGNTLCNGCVIL